MSPQGDRTDENGSPRGIPFRAMIPNAITALALCLGLTGVSLAIGGEWEKALGAIVLAGVLDGLDGRIARLLRAQSKFGAELDSLSDNIAFGTAPALIMFLWSLQTAPRFGWIAALALAVCCALRLARFNARLDAAEQPHKSAGFNTGVPAPAGAGLAFVPVYLWLITGDAAFRAWQPVMAWTLFIAALMISSLPTYSWASIRIRKGWRLFALAGVALFGGALVVVAATMHEASGGKVRAALKGQSAEPVRRTRPVRLRPQRYRAGRPAPISLRQRAAA